MTDQQRSKSEPLFGLIFIAGVFVVTFLLVRGTMISSAPEGPLSLLPLSEINILYLADESKISSESNRHPDRLLQNLSNTIEVVDDSVAAARALDRTALNDLDVLIVDQSALTFVNPLSVANAFDAGVVVFSLNIPVKQFSELINAPYILVDNFAANPYPGDFFIYSRQAVTGENPDEVARIKQAQRTTGESNLSGISGKFRSSFSAGASELDTEQDFEIFSKLLQQRASQRALSK
jgi:hypothetical protein